jgi:phage FluMu gp28-like protein
MNDRELLNRFTRMKDDPWEFCKAVRTLDQADEKNPVKPFPVHLDYLKLYTRVWQREKAVAVPKSRRMKLSWINIVLYLWDTMFHVGKHNAFVSKKEDDSDELVERAYFVYQNLDEAQIPKELRPKANKTFAFLDFPEINSKIQGFPSGADQMRQFTLSGMLFDELAFWDDAEDTYGAAIPTLEGGGRVTLISSVAPGYFKRVVYDELDAGTGSQFDGA